MILESCYSNVITETIDMTMRTRRRDWSCGSISSLGEQRSAGGNAESCLPERRDLDGEDKVYTLGYFNR